MPGTSKGFWRKKLFPLAFSPVDLSHHPLPSNEEAHSLGASSTHQDGNLKLHPLRSLWKSGSTLSVVLKEVCFFYANSQPHPAAYHIDTISPLRDTCQLPEGRDWHLSCSQLRFPNLEQFQTQSGGSAHTCWRNGCCNQVPPLGVASGVGSGFEPFHVISFSSNGHDDVLIAWQLMEKYSVSSLKKCRIIQVQTQTEYSEVTENHFFKKMIRMWFFLPLEEVDVHSEKKKKRKRKEKEGERERVKDEREKRQIREENMWLNEQTQSKNRKFKSSRPMLKTFVQ